jgi:hypothetical protein
METPLLLHVTSKNIGQLGAHNADARGRKGARDGGRGVGVFGR